MVRENEKKGRVWVIKGLDAGDTRSLTGVNERMCDVSTIRDGHEQTDVYA
jgi:hypothetical protein